MDTLAHMLWTLIFFYKYKYVGYAMLFGVLPDLSSWGIYLVYRIGKRVPFGKPDLSIIPKWVFILYGITHSVIIFAAIFFCAWVVLGAMPIVMLPWIIHLLMDIPTHTREFLGTPFLWPISSWLFPGISWGTKWFMLINYFVMAVFLSLTFLFGRNLFFNFG
jgi:hypothetical protein